MQAFQTTSGRALTLLQPNIDTDVIIRINRLNEVRMQPQGRSLLGRWAFESLRYAPDGSEQPGCIFNDQRFRGASILIAGPNFGCGSSREGAVWAMAGIGIRCVIAESFGDIFHANCFQNGMLPIVLPASEVARLAEEAAGLAELCIDLEQQTISAASGRTIPFDVDASRRHALLLGLDEIGETMQHAADVAAWQVADQVNRPWMWNL